MTELQEPITTIEPILGLGEDYEPEVAWSGTGGSFNHIDPLPDETAFVFPTRKDAEAICGLPVIMWEIPPTVAKCHACGLSLALIDADLNILRTWPV